MKYLTTAAAAILLSTPAFAADAVLGLYKTQPSDSGNFGHVQIYECEDAICGVIRKAFDASGAEIESDNIGKRMIWDMQVEGSGAYGGGKIWAPDRDKTYSSKMALEGSILKVSGCVFGICRAQTWQKLN